MRIKALNDMVDIFETAIVKVKCFECDYVFETKPYFDGFYQCPRCGFFNTERASDRDKLSEPVIESKCSSFESKEPNSEFILCWVARQYADEGQVALILGARFSHLISPLDLSTRKAIARELIITDYSRLNLKQLIIYLDNMLNNIKTYKFTPESEAFKTICNGIDVEVRSLE